MGEIRMNVRMIISDLKPKDIIKNLRNLTGKTQKDFSKSLGISRQVLQRYEYGTSNYDVDLLLTIASREGFKIIIEKDD